MFLGTGCWPHANLSTSVSQHEGIYMMSYTPHQWTLSNAIYQAAFWRMRCFQQFSSLLWRPPTTVATRLRQKPPITRVKYIATMSQHSAACTYMLRTYRPCSPDPLTKLNHYTGCSVPPVVSKGYEPKGKYIEVDGMRTCKSIPCLCKFCHILTSALL